MIRVISELALEGPPIHRIGGKDLCELLALSSGALTDLKQRQIAVHLSHDVYDLEATVQNYVRHLRAIAAGRGGEEQSLTLTGERARLARAQAEAQEVKNAKLRGELVEASEVERAWSDILRQVRARVLAVPSRVRADLPAIEAQTITAFDRALRDALTELGHAD